MFIRFNCRVWCTANQCQNFQNIFLIFFELDNVFGCSNTQLHLAVYCWSARCASFTNDTCSWRALWTSAWNRKQIHALMTSAPEVYGVRQTKTTTTKETGSSEEMASSSLQILGVDEQRTGDKNKRTPKQFWWGLGRWSIDLPTVGTAYDDNG